MIFKHKFEVWFQFSRKTLAPILEQRNELLHSLNRRSKDMPQHIADHTKSELKQLQKYINDMVALANSRLYSGLSCKIHDMNMNPHVAW